MAVDPYDGISGDHAESEGVVEAALELWQEWRKQQDQDPEFDAGGNLRRLMHHETEYGHMILTVLAYSDDIGDRFGALDGLEELADLVEPHVVMPILRLLSNDNDLDIQCEAMYMTRELRHKNTDAPVKSFTIPFPPECTHRQR